MNNNVEASVEQRLREFIEREDLRYQAMDLPGGLTTPGHERTYLNEIIFSEPLEGQSLLDVGTFLGYFCIEALRRGAAASTGVDANRESLRKANELADILGYSPEYILGDFETMDFGPRKFDVVLGLNVLHHMFDAVHSLRKMMTLARRRVIIEVATLSWRDYKFNWFNPLALAVGGMPIIHMGYPKTPGRLPTRTFLFTPASMRLLFNTHSGVFEPIRIIKSPFKGRFIVDARKRQIRNLVVVAGATSSGKSTYAKRLMNEPELRRAAGMAEADWIHVRAKNLDSLPSGPLENVLLELDLFSAVRAELISFDRHPLFQILDVAENLDILTILPPTGRHQMREEEIRRLRKKAGKLFADELAGWYAGSGGGRLLKQVYEAWFAHASAADVASLKHKLVVNDWQAFRIEPMERFEALFGATGDDQS
jgi:2-polyprenyl-3-methyl-5-hydroxy-6-metoxy-1,4-benzoquinol methylase